MCLNIIQHAKHSPDNHGHRGPTETPRREGVFIPYGTHAGVADQRWKKRKLPSGWKASLGEREREREREREVHAATT